jgi:hypothetical protein
MATWKSTRAGLLAEKPEKSARAFDPVGITRAGMQDMHVRLETQRVLAENHAC